MEFNCLRAWRLTVQPGGPLGMERTMAGLTCLQFARATAMPDDGILA
jgi:hypothetical protein